MNNRLKILDEEDTERLLDWTLIDTIEEVLKSESIAPLRASIWYGDSWFGAMPAAGLGLISTKLVGVYPGNKDRGLPTVRGLVAVFRSDTGDPLFIADAIPITGYRTAAATCLALRLLGYRGGGQVTIIGAGTQGYYHAKCIKEYYNPYMMKIYDSIHGKAHELAVKIGKPVEAVRDPQEIYDSQTIILATTSKTPVINGKMLRENTIIASIGAPKPVRELDDETLRRTRCILVDTLKGFMEEAGEVEHLPKDKTIIELRQIIKGESKCEHGDIRVYKSVGTALFDHAAAVHMARKLKII